jgi:hypothetical protein
MYRAELTTARIKLLLVMSLFAGPALAAWIAHQLWAPTAAASYGELLPPSMPALAGMRDSAGRPADLASLRGRWVLLTVVNGACGSTCRQQLDLARRVRLAQGRDQARVVRVLIQAAMAAPVEQQGLHNFRMPGEALAAWPDPVRTYLVDPLGRVMLRFPVAAEGKGMLRDLRQLLKASRIG